MANAKQKLNGHGDGMPVWIGDAKIDPVWIKRQLVLPCKSCHVEDVSNRMRRGGRHSLQQCDTLFECGLKEWWSNFIYYKTGLDRWATVKHWPGIGKGGIFLQRINIPVGGGDQQWLGTLVPPNKLFVERYVVWQYILSNMDPSEHRACGVVVVWVYYDELVRLGVW
jgi:hypothetical protein